MKEADSVDNNIEQSQETAQEPAVVDRADLVEIHATASRLIEELRGVPDGDLVGEVIANALKLLRDRTNRGDIKLIDKSFKELRYALKVFAPYRDTRKASIFGSARTLEDHEDYRQAAYDEPGEASSQHLLRVRSASARRFLPPPFRKRSGA